MRSFDINDYKKVDTFAWKTWKTESGLQAVVSPVK